MIETVYNKRSSKIKQLGKFTAKNSQTFLQKFLMLLGLTPLPPDF